MKQIAQVLLFDRDRRLLIYLRDDKPNIPFPNHWDFFGGHIEAGENPEEALVREVREELGIALARYEFVRRYECWEGDVYPNIKHIFCAQIDQPAEELVIREGQKLAGISAEERFNYQFANILSRILDDFIAENLWPPPVDNFRGKMGEK